EWPERRSGDFPDDSSAGRRPRRGRGQGRSAAPPFRSPQGFLPEREPARDKEFPPDFEGQVPDFPANARIDQPARRRGGRVAIRSRGGDTGRPRDPSSYTEPGMARPARFQPAQGDLESDRGRSRPPERYSEPDRRRPSGPTRARDRDRDRDRDR